MKSNQATKPWTERKDADLKTDVLAELDFQPSVKATDVGVTVKAGVVTLSGEIASYGEKWQAVEAAQRVAGVKAIVDKIEVNMVELHIRSDADIAVAVANQIAWSQTVPKDGIKVVVRDGWVSLSGSVEWWYQKNDVGGAVRYLTGVKGVTNDISLKTKSEIEPDVIETAITNAFKRSALIDAQQITVGTSKHAATLYGTARNSAERDEAERIAWAAAGVTAVDNQIQLVWNWKFWA